MVGNSHSLRAARFLALSRLSHSGYQAERIGGSQRWFDIIAWNRQKILYLIVRTSRTRSVRTFSSEILLLCSLVRNLPFSGEIQFWLYCNADLIRYQVLAGGAVPLHEEHA